MTEKKSDSYFNRYTRYTFLFLFFVFNSIFLMGQDLNARSPKPLAGSHQQQVADKKKAKKKKAMEADIKKGEKRHMKLQAKNTRKMMKKSKRTSKQWNDR